MPNALYFGALDINIILKDLFSP